MQLLSSVSEANMVGRKMAFQGRAGGQALPKRGASVGPYEDSFALERK